MSTFIILKSNVTVFYGKMYCRIEMKFRDQCEDFFPFQSTDTDQRLRDLEEQLRTKEERLFANELQLRRTSLHAEAATEEAVQLRLQLSEKEALMAAQQQQIDRLQRHVADVTSDLEASVVERCRLSREFAHISEERQRNSKDLSSLVTSANFAEQVGFE